MSKNRQLAAVMFTDIEGYTSLMQRDEEKALHIRKRHREIFVATTEAFNGKIIQYFGDGTLSVFKSAVEAVQCAIEMQIAFQQEPQVPLRVGIHIGDIIFSKEDIIGDAVNIASRIESIAVSGSILISDKVNDQLRNHQELHTKFLDAYDLKNVESAIPIFAIANEQIKVPKAEEIKAKIRGTRTKRKKTNGTTKIATIIGLLLCLLILVFYFDIFSPKVSTIDKSIAVLPFDNLSTDEDAEIFRDGMTEDILTNLSKVGELRVISRTSVMQYKNTEKTIPEIAEELGVNYILEGSIRKYGDEIRVTTQLIDAVNDEHLWAENYDKTLTDIFAIQSEVSKEIVDALQLNISFEEQQNLMVKPTSNIEAYQNFLRGKNQADLRTSAGLNKSLEFYQKAIDLDENYAEAYAEMANSYFLQAYYSRKNPLEASDIANTYLNKAEEINPKISRIYTVRGLMYNFQMDFDNALKSFTKAIELSPNDVTARHQFATFYFYNQKYKEQLEQTEIAYSLDPLSFATATSYFSALTYNEKYEEAEKVLNIMIELSNGQNDFVVDRSYMRLYMALPDYEKAIPHLKEIIKTEPSYTRLLGYAYAKLGDKKEAYQIIDTLKLQDRTILKNHRIAVIFTALEETDSVFYYLDTARNKSIRFNSPRIMYFDAYKDNPKYQELLQQHGVAP